MSEQEKIARLEAKGYKVELFNPDGGKFNERYVVYQVTQKPLGFGNGIPQNKIVCIDADGNVI